MTSKASTVEEYLNEVPNERREAVEKLRAAIKKNLPEGFEETMSYGMIGYVVPKSKYPDGYHCDPELPLPFINLASQKAGISLYHMWIYQDPELLAWFEEEYPKHANRKLDMGKSCIRFKKLDDIPYELIGELASKMSADEWIRLYEQNVKR